MSQPIAIAVLAGGKSRRMGHDKALAPIAGEHFLERIVRRLLPLGLPVIVVGRERPNDWPIGDVRFVADDGEGAGPLRGLATALRAAGGDLVAVACDMPLLDAEAAAWLMARAEESDAARDDGVAVLHEGKIEPLFSFYRGSLLPAIEDRLRRGELSVRAMIDGGRFRRVELPASLAGRLRNINTPGELEELRRELGI